MSFDCDLKLLYAGKVLEYKKSSERIFNCCRSDKATSVQEGKIKDEAQTQEHP